MASYGLPIKKSDADQMFQSFKEIKARTASQIGAILQKDSEALRFINGNDVAYVFERDSIQMLLSRLKAKEDCIILFTGSRYDVDGKVNGRPTLIAFAYNVKDNGAGHKIATINLGAATETDDGSEHPGNFQIDVSMPSSIPDSIDLTGVTFLGK
jgi:hypothetical protein